jgi:type IV secretory pathway VirB10-like protein
LVIQAEAAMSFNTSSFFIGVGTVLVTIGVGFGAGVLMTNAFVGNKDREATKLEQRVADKPESKIRSITTSVSPVSEAKAEEAPLPPPAVQPAISPAVEESFAKAPDRELQREQRRLERNKRAEQRKLAERNRRKQHQRALARVRQQEMRERQQPEQVAQSPSFAPFNFEN